MVSNLPHPNPKIFRYDSRKSSLNHEKWHYFHMFSSMCPVLLSLRGMEHDQICNQWRAHHVTFVKLSQYLGQLLRNQSYEAHTGFHPTNWLTGSANQDIMHTVSIHYLTVRSLSLQSMSLKRSAYIWDTEYIMLPNLLLPLSIDAKTRF